MIWKYLKISKVITYIVIGIFIIVSFFSFWNYTTVNNRKYKKLLIERDTLIIHKAKLNKWANDTQRMLDETMQAKKTNDSLFQILVQEQSKDIKAKSKAIERYKNGLICKVPQKIKVGFMKHRTVLVEVNCDSLEKTLR
jgi:hypothetical protein